MVPEQNLINNAGVVELLDLLDTGAAIGESEFRRWRLAAEDGKWTAAEAKEAARWLNLNHTGYVKIAHVHQRITHVREMRKVAEKRAHLHPDFPPLWRAFDPFGCPCEDCGNTLRVHQGDQLWLLRSGDHKAHTMNEGHRRAHPDIMTPADVERYGHKIDRHGRELTERMLEAREVWQVQQAEVVADFLAGMDWLTWAESIKS